MQDPVGNERRYAATVSGNSTRVRKKGLLRQYGADRSCLECVSTRGVQRMTPADIALALFTGCNSIRVIAYAPQIVRVARDSHGASAISYTTWILFATSHLSTVAYAIFVIDDWKMSIVFGANTFCCLLIIGLTATKRRQFRLKSAHPGTSTQGMTAMDGHWRKLCAKLEAWTPKFKRARVSCLGAWPSKAMDGSTHRPSSEIFVRSVVSTSSQTGAKWYDGLPVGHARSGTIASRPCAGRGESLHVGRKPNRRT